MKENRPSNVPYIKKLHPDFVVGLEPAHPGQGAGQRTVFKPGTREWLHDV